MSRLAWLLARELRASENFALAAATALALHRSADAFQPLIEGAKSVSKHGRHASLIGLRRRGDRSACADVALLLNHRDPITRYQPLRTLAGLGCLEIDDVQRLVSDEDPDVKASAETLVNTPR